MFKNDIFDPGQECSEEPVEECAQQEMMVPTQEKEHKKKCLLPDDGSFGTGNTEPAPAPRQSRTLNVQGRGANGRLSLGPQAVQQRQGRSQQNTQLPLDRLALGAAASTRNSRTFSASTRRPHGT